MIEIRLRGCALPTAELTMIEALREVQSVLLDWGVEIAVAEVTGYEEVTDDEQTA